MSNGPKIKITAEDATQQAIRSAIGGMQKLQASLGGLDVLASRMPFIGTALTAAFGGASFVGLIKSSIDAADELDKLAQKTGSTVEELAGLKYVAEQNDTSLQGIADAAKKLSVNLASTPELFQQLGIKSKDTTGALIDLADTFATMPDGATKTALAVKLLGKSGADMIPLLNQGSAALRSMVEQGQKMNPVTAENAKQAAEFNDNMKKLEFAAAAVGTELAKTLLPGLASSSEQMAKLAQEGNLLGASFVALGAAMKLPWDLLFPPPDLKKELAVDGRLLDLKIQLGDLQRHFESAKFGGALQRWLYGKPEDMERNMEILRNQIATIEKHREELSKPMKAVEKPQGDGLDVTGLTNGYVELVKQMKDRAVLLQAEINNEAKLTETQKFREKILADIANGTMKLTGAQKDNVKTSLDQLVGMDAEISKRRELGTMIAQQKAVMNSLTGDFDLQAEASRRSMQIMSESQRQLGAEMDKIMKAQQKAIETADKDFAANTKDGFAEAAAKHAESLNLITTEAERQRDVIRKLRDEQDQLNSTWEHGAASAMQKFADEAANTAAQAERVFTKAFNGMADELTKFVMTGKLDFSQLANSIISDLIRIQIQKALVGLFGNFAVGASAVGSSSGSGATGSFEGGGYTGSGSRSGGLDGRGGFIAMLHPNETVIDHTRGQTGMGSGVTYHDNTVINVDSRADRAQVMADISRVVDSKNAQMVDKLQRLGMI